MQCQLCQAEEASIHLKQIVNDEISELHVCQQCAAKSGVNLQKELNVGELAGLLANLEAPAAEREAPAPSIRCGECHMSLDEYRKRRRLGCPACYDAFRDHLSDVLLEIQKGKQHVGKCPSDEGLQAERRRLLRLQEAAIVEQRFEEAAVLRDRLRELGAAGPSDEPISPEN